ncbi:hypothetical protein PoB_003890200 [Plakobranchus ocellatus]|uniref:Uncharacterized protein n=1 Tax=Plakobranchus ocellatus TaxID=259542 RepID=A0AAV4AYN1_9GAST|nr:hypothetical protein PoB_003890200 [Plakobranchus ocellatus]
MVRPNCSTSSLSQGLTTLFIPWPDGGPESLRSPCCGLAIYKNPQLSSSLLTRIVCSDFVPERSPDCGHRLTKQVTGSRPKGVMHFLLDQLATVQMRVPNVYT